MSRRMGANQRKDPQRTAAIARRSTGSSTTLTPIDNSPTEREFQNIAKLRLNMLFARSSEGAHRACVLLGIVASCRVAGHPHATRRRLHQPPGGPAIYGGAALVSSIALALGIRHVRNQGG